MNVAKTLNGNGKLFSPQVITSAGGIVIAVVLIWYFAAAVDHNAEAIITHDKNVTAIRQETNNVLRDMSTVVEANTEVMRSLQGSIERMK